MKRLFHLRKLREFHVNPQLVALFYHSIVERVALFRIIVWGRVTKKTDPQHQHLKEQEHRYQAGWPWAVKSTQTPTTQ